MAFCRPLDPRDLQNHPQHIAIGRGGPSPSHLLFKHARLRYALRIVWVSPTTPSSVRNHAGLPRPLGLPSLPTKADFNPKLASPIPPHRMWYPPYLDCSAREE